MMGTPAKEDLLFCIACGADADDLLPPDLVACPACESAHCRDCDHWCDGDDEDLEDDTEEE